MNREQTEERIVFLDPLRGVAVSLVVWAHLFMVGINDPNTVKLFTPGMQNPLFGEGAPLTNIHGLINLFFVLNLGVGAGMYVAATASALIDRQIAAHISLSSAGAKMPSTGMIWAARIRGDRSA